eukprot:TRINITY_DN2054_c0_g1_i2.p1 TRINITY_DN2054_c0_g1~~TRINITY_DN2054_c0_g1_i2.p1  ORF type:complete len:358 (-),score=58.05 TRINITY_DN2054_c0_g1_i2:274-1347(-)
MLSQDDPAPALPPTSLTTKLINFANRVVQFVHTNYMIFLLILALLTAAAFPSVGGKLKPKIVSKMLIALIFFSNGLTLPTNQLRKTIFEWKLHLIIQLYSFLFIPLFVLAIVHLLRPILGSMSQNDDDEVDYNDDDSPPSNDLEGLLLGLLLMASAPTTNSSNVVMTTNSKGNTAAALFNAVFGNSLGILVTPLLLIFLGAMPDTYQLSFVSLFPLFLNLFLLVLFPLLIGQIVRGSASYFFHYDGLPKLLPWSHINNVSIVIIVYFTFCDTFSKNFDITWKSLILIMFVVLVLLLFFQFVIWILFFATETIRKRWLGFRRFFFSHHFSNNLAQLFKTIYRIDKMPSPFCFVDHKRL